jgi:hypothetical protein
MHNLQIGQSLSHARPAQDHSSDNQGNGAVGAGYAILRRRSALPRASHLAGLNPRQSDR